MHGEKDPLNLNDLIAQITNIRDECNWEAHPFGKDLELTFWIDDKKYAITSVESKQAFGCGCWIGVDFGIEERNK
jgi:hypothetical protein